MTVSAGFWQAIVGVRFQPFRKVETVKSVPVAAPAFFGSFWVQEKTKWPRQITGRTGFPRGTRGLERKIRPRTTLPGTLSAALAADALGTARACRDAYLKANGNPKTCWAGCPFLLPINKVTSFHLACGYMLNLPAPVSLHLQRVRVGACLADAGISPARLWVWRGCSPNQGAVASRRFYWHYPSAVLF